MKSKSACLGILVFALAHTPCVLADEASEAFKGGMEKRHEGMKEVVTSPTHMVEDTGAGMEGENPVMDTASGAVTGTAKTGGQVLEGAGGMVEGTGEMLTAPVEAITE